MKTRRLIIAIAFFLFPILTRSLWFYNSFPGRRIAHEIPNYADIKLEEPRISTPMPDEFISTSESITILVDQSHENMFNLTEIEALHSELLLRGANIIIAEDNASFRDGLPKSNAILLITPTIPFSIDEVEAVEEFVSRGGRLLVVADPTKSDAELLADKEKTIVQINQLLQPFGLLFNNDYVYNLQKNEGNYRNVYVHPSGFSDLAEDITSLVFYGSHSIGIFGQSIVTGDAHTFSSISDAGKDLPVAALDNSGSVLALGDLTFMTNPYFQVEDNNLFIRNIADFLVGADREKNLQDFPNLFNHDIGILFMSEITLNSDILEILSDLQAQYAKDDLQISLLEKSQNEFDEIILGIYPPDDDLKEWTDELGFIYENGDVKAQPKPTAITEDDETTTPTPDEDNTVIEVSNKSILIPEFGAIPREGFGFLILDKSEGKNRLFLLADSEVNCVNLFDLVSSGSLYGCLVGDNVAICEQDIKVNNFKDEDIEEIVDEDFPDSTDNDEFLDETDTPTPTPTETPPP